MRVTYTSEPALDWHLLHSITCKLEQAKWCSDDMSRTLRNFANAWCKTYLSEHQWPFDDLLSCQACYHRRHLHKERSVGRGEKVGTCVRNKKQEAGTEPAERGRERLNINTTLNLSCIEEKSFNTAGMDSLHSIMRLRASKLLLLADSCVKWAAFVPLLHLGMIWLQRGL